MRLSGGAAFAFAVGAVAIATPILVSIQIARNQSLAAEKDRVLGHARDVLRRSNETGLQVRAGVERILGANAAPCSAEEIAVMREIDISSSYIQAIGRVADGRVICSSLGLHDPSIPLGPIGYVSKTGAVMRYDVDLPCCQGEKFFVLELQGIAAVIHQGLLIDASTDRSDISLATLGLGSRAALSQRGVIKPEWRDMLGERREISFSDGEYVVAIVRSDRVDIAAVAAVPVTYLDARVKEFAAIFVPIGMVGGAALAWAVLYLARRQLSMRSVLRAALRHNEFFVEYQPIVDLRSRKWVGAEAGPLAAPQWGNGATGPVHPGGGGK